MMVRYSTTILKFGLKGEKTGWTYIEIPADIAQKLKTGNKKPFRVKGRLDLHPIEKTALMPMGDGSFILPLNATLRKKIKKGTGDKLHVQMEEDKSPLSINAELLLCLEEEQEALTFFNQFAPSHQRYFSNWIDSAKTEVTRAKRIAHTINALLKKQDFGQMMRSLKSERR